MPTIDIRCSLVLVKACLANIVISKIARTMAVTAIGQAALWSSNASACRVRRVIFYETVSPGFVPVEKQASNRWKWALLLLQATPRPLIFRIEGILLSKAGSFCRPRRAGRYSKHGTQPAPWTLNCPDEQEVFVPPLPHLGQGGLVAKLRPLLGVAT